MNDTATREQWLKEQIVNSSTVLFAGMVLLLQTAAYYAAGGDLELDIYNRTLFSFTMPDWFKWIGGALGLILLIWALVLLLTARFDWLTRKIGQKLERFSRPSVIIAEIAIAFGWVQGVIFSAQAGFGDWYFFTVFFLGLAFCIIFVTLPARRKRETKA